MKSMLVSWKMMFLEKVKSSKYTSDYAIELIFNDVSSFCSLSLLSSYVSGKMVFRVRGGIELRDFHVEVGLKKANVSATIFLFS